MAKTKSYVQLKADLARVAEQEAAIKKQIAEAEKKQKEVAIATIGKTFFECYSDEDLLSKSTEDLKQFVKDHCVTDAKNREEAKAEAKSVKDSDSDSGSASDEDGIGKDSVKDENQNKPAKRPYNPSFGMG